MTFLPTEVSESSGSRSKGREFEGMMEAPLTDSFRRRLTYLRLSITDRCNLRCRYCMPQSSFSWMPSENILTFEEIHRICRAFCRSGIKKIRLTGGEPLVRRGLVDLIRKLNRLQGLEEICLTTNGTLLGDHAAELLDAGVTHINISLDTMVPDTYASITGADMFHQVWNSIMKVIELGFPQVKINAVVIKGVTDSDIYDLAELATIYPIDVRFIEFMPVGDKIPWSPDSMISSDEVRGMLEQRMGHMEPVERSAGAGPASLYRLKDAPGLIGFISPLSHHFCSTCNRLRITADGKLRLCLFSDSEIDVKSPVRRGMTDGELEQFLRKSAAVKPEGYHALGKEQVSCTKRMSSIGG